MNENPFQEPGEGDRTVIRPTPGGVRRAAPAPRPAPAPPAPTGPEIEAVVAGDGPLAIAASPLLTLLARLRNAATAPDPADMRERTRRELRAFERRAKDAGLPPDQVRMTHYALCAALDDVVLNTPWGNHGRWKDEPLSIALHDDADSGRGFFEQLRSLRDAMPGARPVVEIMFMCLSLGMMGPYRAAPDGPAQLDRVRHHVFELVSKAAPPAGPALAPRTAGVQVPVEKPGRVPVWVGASVALAAAAAMYVWCLSSLNAAGDAVYASALAAPPAAMPALVRPPFTPPPPPPQPPPGPADRLRAALAGTPADVIATPAATIVRIPARTLFPRSNATLAPGPLLDRVATALAAETGPVRVLAYSEAAPPRSVAFPSAFALTTAQAAAVKAALARSMPGPARLSAEGRADSDRLVPDPAAEANRRVDIVLAAAP